MTGEDKKRIFGYMGWRMPCDGKAEEYCITEDDKHTCRICEFYHPLDGNDMVAAIDKMWEKGEWFGFFAVVCLKHFSQTLLSKTSPNLAADLFHWLMQPARFFELMANWLEEQK